MPEFTEQFLHLTNLFYFFLIILLSYRKKPWLSIFLAYFILIKLYKVFFSFKLESVYNLSSELIFLPGIILGTLLFLVFLKKDVIPSLFCLIIMLLNLFSFFYPAVWETLVEFAVLNLFLFIHATRFSFYIKKRFLIEICLIYLIIAGIGYAVISKFEASYKRGIFLRKSTELKFLPKDTRI